MAQRKAQSVATAGVAALLVLAAGCPVKQPPAPAEIRAQGTTDVDLGRSWAAPGATPGMITDEWVATFRDPELDRLILEAITNNPDLRIGATRVEQATIHVRLAKARLLPGISILGRGSSKFAADLSTGLSGGVFSVSWEADVWGRLRYARNATEETELSIQADYAFARESIAAATAASWFAATESLLQRGLAEEMVRDAEELVTLARKRLEVGASDERDVVAAEADVTTYRDGLEQLRRAHQESLRALEILLGRYPSAELQARGDLTPLPGPVPAGMPLEILERRPDMVAAERRIAAAFDRVGEAKAARLPSLALNVGGGYLSSEVLQLQDDYDPPTAGLSAQVLAPLYAGGALKGQVEIRTSEQKQAVAEYTGMALRAIGEVEGALAAAHSLEERELILQESVDRNDRALELEQIAFRVGRIDQRAVLGRQLALNGARASLLRVQSEQLAQRVNLHLALGGSFELPVSPTDLSVAAP